MIELITRVSPTGRVAEWWPGDPTFEVSQITRSNSEALAWNELLYVPGLGHRDTRSGGMVGSVPAWGRKAIRDRVKERMRSRASKAIGLLIESERYEAVILILGQSMALGNERDWPREVNLLEAAATYW